MNPEKNHKRLVSIFGAIARRNANARLILVGLGGNDTERHVLEHIAKLNLSGRVAIAGLRGDVPRLLKSTDLMLFPSLREGLPGAVLEACAAGLPVLATDLPGVREIAAHFPCVHYLSLAETDDNWASTAQQMCDEVRLDDVTVADLFARSSFRIEDCVAAHCSTWEGSA